jgi:ribose transport system ATP-binding protein
MANDAPSATPLALNVRGLHKAFPGLVALHDVDLEIAAGEVRALVGENGAGKSTLIKIVAGALHQDAGTIEIGGLALRRPSPASAARAGVAVIHQDRQIGADLSVAENVLLGKLPERLPCVTDWKAAYRLTADLLAQVGLDVDPRTPTKQLSIAEHQALEIARALHGDPALVIMDEPTASLSQDEIQRLFAIIKRLQARGRSVLYISHHLEEIFTVADSVTVLRDGAVVATRSVAEIDSHELTNLMFGRDMRQLESAVRNEATSAQAVVLEARDLHADGALRGVDVTARAGEVLCITGGIGSGRRELARSLVGAQRLVSGQVRRMPGGTRVRSPRQAIRNGIGFVTDDRKHDGVLLSLDLIENIDLARLSVGHEVVVRWGRRRSRASELASELKIRSRALERPAQELSGGNQQKALVGRVLNFDADVLVFDEPTNGVDVSTKLELYALLRGLAAKGSCVIVFSSDYEEIKLLADRVLVMRRGRIVDEFAHDQLSEERLLAVATEAEKS